MNYKQFLFLLAGSLFFQGSPVLSQNNQFSMDFWEDPSIFEISQNDPHAFHVPYCSVKEALLDKASECENYMLLNGSWKFKWYERPELVPEEFQDPSFNTKKWNDIKVPSNWQMEGYGHPKFRNVALSFESDPPNIPDYYNPAGCYVRSFTLPSSWKEREVILRFEGIKSASYLWINGKEVGYNQGGFEPAEYTITPYLKKGKNTIAVLVIRFSDGSYLENQDMWRLSGIFRDVKLYAQPKVFIQDFYQTTDLDKTYKNATLKLELNVKNAGTETKRGYRIRADVLDKNDKTILFEPLISETIDIAGNKSVTCKLESYIENPLKWSDEFPNLYTIVYALEDDNGNTLEAFSKKIGFREVEIRKDVFYLNGVPIKLNGVNSHMHHPEHGQAVPIETLRKDLILMKQHNINAVRTCHYPPSPEYLYLADELGMYIINEVGDEAHGNIQLSYDTSFTEMYKDRSRKLVYRDRNHASVIMWSAGNESGSGPNINEVIKTGKAIDPSRPGWMYGGNTFYIPFEDITGPRYWIPYQLRNLAEGKVLDEDDLRPSFMDEYIAATGNGLGMLDEYWELIRKYPRLMGGAIWDWISPGIKTPLWIIPDGSQYKNDGVIMGRPEFVSESHHNVSGRALKFSGHDDWIEFYREAALDITGNQLSISFWVKPEKIPQPNTFITKGDHQYGILMNTQETLEFYVQSNNLLEISHGSFYKSQSRRISAIGEVPENWYDTWHHVLGVYNGSKLMLYIDSERIAEKEYTGNIAHSPYPLCIGRNAEIHDQGEFSGRLSCMTIDEVQVFNAALAPEDLSKLVDHANSVLSLNFESDSKEGDFYAVGLGGRTYGIIWPDRTPQPEIMQLKKSGQKVKIEALDLENGRYRFTNYHHFMDLNELDIWWTVLREGIRIDSGKLDIDLAPLKQKEANILLPKYKTYQELVLEISCRLRDGNAWAETGYELAWEQFIIKEAQDIEISKSEGDLEIRDSAEHITMVGGDFKYVIQKTNGHIAITKNKRTYFQSGPELSVWRAPLANDIDPWGAYFFSDDKKTPGLGRSIDNQLRTYGLRDLVVEVDTIYYEVAKSGEVLLFIHKYYHSSSMRGAFENKEKYTISADGTIEAEVQIIPTGFMPDMLPRLGFEFHLPKAYEKIEWYGRGPFETYPDRKTGAKIGIHQSDVNAEYVPYIIPQDYGNHTDVRWFEISANNGSGIRVTAEEPLNFSYHKYSTDNLSKAYYTYQLSEANYNTLHLNFEMSGVGGTAVRQLEQYRVKPMVKTYSFTIHPY
ncbi:glycoside hydrolase family 2 TIM barrel-domain containing protein [Bacteroidota bacterium]